LPDSGRGYLSKIFNDDWMTTYGFLSKDGALVKEILDEKGEKSTRIVHVQPEDTVAHAKEVMEEHQISQVIVAQGPLPLSAAEVKGTLTAHAVKKASLEDPDLNIVCSTLMDESLEFIGIGESVDTVKSILEKGTKLLVLDEGKPCTVLTFSDYIRYEGSREKLRDGD
jgi:cystathionine beta-synthase